MSQYINAKTDLFIDYRSIKRDFAKLFKDLNVPKHRMKSSHLLSFFYDKNPYFRMGSLIKLKKLIPYRDELPSDKDIKNIIKIAFDYLCVRRPATSIHANYNDAFILSQIAFFNANSSNKKMFHITSSSIMVKAAFNLSHSNPIFESLLLDHVPLIINNNTWAWKSFYSFTELWETILNCETLDKVDEFSKLKARIINYLRNPKATNLVAISAGIYKYKAHLEEFKKITTPFYQDLIEVEENDYSDSQKAIGGSIIADNFDEAYDFILKTLSELLLYLEPLSESYKPFQDLWSECD
jgi:hypothetical protein